MVGSNLFQTSLSCLYLTFTVTSGMSCLWMLLEGAIGLALFLLSGISHHCLSFLEVKVNQRLFKRSQLALCPYSGSAAVRAAGFTGLWCHSPACNKSFFQSFIHPRSASLNVCIHSSVSLWFLSDSRSQVYLLTPCKCRHKTQVCPRWLHDPGWAEQPAQVTNQARCCCLCAEWVSICFQGAAANAVV